MRTIMIRLAALALILGLLANGGKNATAQDDGDTLNVIASFSILGDLVENVGGDAVEVTTLVGTGADAHTFEPSPADVATLAEADLIVENGLGFEPWLDGLYESSGSEAPRIVVSDGLDLIEAGTSDDDHGNEVGGHEDEGDAEDTHEHEGEAATPEGNADDHEHGAFDPHVWHDVANAMQMVETIRDALVAADPDNAATYEANAERYLAELAELDAWVIEQVETLPEERRKLVTSHDTFAYFAARYGFQVIGTALGSVSTEVADPSAQEIATLVEEIEAAGVPAIFAENVSNPAVMESIAAEAGVELAPPLATDALGEPGSATDTYLTMIRANVTTIVEALGAALVAP